MASSTHQQPSAWTLEFYDGAVHSTYVGDALSMLTSCVAAPAFKTPPVTGAR